MPNVPRLYMLHSGKAAEPVAMCGEPFDVNPFSPCGGKPQKIVAQNTRLTFLFLECLMAMAYMLPVSLTSFKPSVSIRLAKSGLLSFNLSTTCWSSAIS